MTTTMDKDQFWSIIDSSRAAAAKMKRAPGQDFLDLHEQTLAEALRALPPEDIAAFNDVFWSIHRSAYRWDLWGAAYWLHGGCGDDGFTDFRACMISLGKEHFARVLSNPDALADLAGRPDIPYTQAEGFQYIADRVDFLSNFVFHIVSNFVRALHRHLGIDLDMHVHIIKITHFSDEAFFHCFDTWDCLGNSAHALHQLAARCPIH